MTRRPPASSFNPFPFKSPWTNALDADWKRPVTGDVRSLSIRFSNSAATAPAVSAGFPTSKEYLTPLSVTLYISPVTGIPVIVILSCWASKRGIGSVGCDAEESNSFTDTSAVKVAVALPSHPIATTEIVASPKNPSSQVT